MPNIVDVLIFGEYQQVCILLDKLPEFVYERKGNFLIANDDGFHSVYYYEQPSKNWKAFAGREFDIPMKDGSVIQANGQWWSGSCSDVSSVGYATQEQLDRCYVFTAGLIETDKLNNWLDKNTPSDNYHKYNKR